MTNSQKRLEEILKEFRRKLFKMEEGITVYNKASINRTITQIDKEFVHKDNLPSVGEIKDKIRFLKQFSILNYSDIAMEAIIVNTIRKLIEGNK